MMMIKLFGDLIDVNEEKEEKPNKKNNKIKHKTNNVKFFKFKSNKKYQIFMNYIVIVQIIILKSIHLQVFQILKQVNI